MRILFAALRNGDYRNLDSVVEALARRGHDIFLGAERGDSLFGGQPIVERLTSAYPNVTSGVTPSRDPESLLIASKVRLAGDYLRFLHPMYPERYGLREMARERTPTGILQMTEWPLLANATSRSMMQTSLAAIERALPSSPAIDLFLDSQRPDVVVITPLIGLAATSQPDLLRSALRRRIPTAVMVWSWDNLATKSVIRDIPDALLVWNETQKWEAIHMHGLPSEHVVVTGAQNLDRWFTRRPSRSRAELARAAGLSDDRPYVMWVCSALLPSSPPEPPVVLRWLERLRGSANPAVRDVPILIRPHPSRVAEWDGVDWRRFGNIAMFGGIPVEERARDDFFDSLYYAAAVVGVTTTAFLDAAVVGRPVMSFYDDDLRYEQQDSVHFQYLLNVEDGLLTMAGTLDEHGRQLAMMLEGPPSAVLERQRRFLKAFVRPHGLDVPATDIVADAIERLRSRGSPPAPAGLLGRLGLRVVRRIERHPRWRMLVLDEREVDTATRQGEKARRREEALERKAQQRLEKARRVAERAKRKRR